MNTQENTATFKCFTEFGRCDVSDWTMEYSLSDEEYQRLRAAAKSGKSFRNCEEVEDIYSKIYEKAVDIATEDLVNFDPEAIEDYLDEDGALEDWRADAVYGIWVDFPCEWTN